MQKLSGKHMFCIRMGIKICSTFFTNVTLMIFKIKKRLWQDEEGKEWYLITKIIHLLLLNYLNDIPKLNQTIPTMSSSNFFAYDKF